METRFWLFARWKENGQPRTRSWDFTKNTCLKLVREFEEIKFTHLGSEWNHFAEALVTLASMARIDFGHNVHSLHIDIRNNPAHCCLVEREIDGNPWYYDIENYIQNQTYPMGASKINKKILRRLAMDFYLDEETLNKKSSDGTLLRCLDDVEAKSGEEIYGKKFDLSVWSTRKD